MIVHVLTPLTRPENLHDIEASLQIAQHVARGAFTVRWHVTADPERRSPGGYAIRNEMLDELSPVPLPTDEWVWFLDDDTIAHPDILFRLDCLLARDPLLRAMIVAQTRPAGWAEGCADPERLGNGAHLADGQCAFDTGQVIMRRDMIGDYRFRLERAGDGYLYEDLLQDAPEVAYINEVLAYYNALRP